MHVHELVCYCLSILNEWAIVGQKMREVRDNMALSASQGREVEDWHWSRARRNIIERNEGQHMLVLVGSKWDELNRGVLYAYEYCALICVYECAAARNWRKRTGRVLISCWQCGAARRDVRLDALLIRVGTQRTPSMFVPMRSGERSLPLWRSGRPRRSSYTSISDIDFSSCIDFAAFY